MKKYEIIELIVSNLPFVSTNYKYESAAEVNDILGPKVCKDMAKWLLEASKFLSKNSKKKKVK